MQKSYSPTGFEPVAFELAVHIKTEKVLERRVRALVDFDEAQFGFMPGKETTDALL